jgi:cellobiose phosphorylase
VDAGAVVQRRRQCGEFGFQVTETGGGYTWSVNSRENRLTPWSNDAVSDPPGEVIYLRDEDSGTVWSATPLPIREREPYIIRHGQGYSVFEHTSHGISQELLLFAPLDASVKIFLLRLRNRTPRKRRLSVVHFNELVLASFTRQPRLTSLRRSTKRQGRSLRAILSTMNSPNASHSQQRAKNWRAPLAIARNSSAAIVHLKHRQR